MKALLLIACCLGLLAMPVRAEDAPANLVQNGRFATAEGGLPSGWKVTGAAQEIAVDAAEHPKDVAGSLRVAIKATDENQGGISQTIKNPPKNAALVLKAYMKGTAGRLGYVNIKLKRAGKELKRAKTAWNTDDWAEQSVEIATDDADEITVECRFSQSDKAKGQTVWFADVRLAAK